MLISMSAQIRRENHLQVITVNTMGISQICQTIKNYFQNVRTPFPQVPRILLVCSMIKRPGLSVVNSVSNITKDLNRIGIPTGTMPDGSTNLTIGFTYAVVNEVYRAIRKDMSIQVGIQPGTLNIVSGPGAGTNVTPGIGLGSAY